MQFQKNLITIAAALAFGAASTTLFAAPITTEGVGVGKHGDIRVAVTFDNGKIQKIDILKNAENPVLSKKVFTDLKDQVAAASSVQVDIVSGATFTSKGMLDAIEDAAKKAGVTLGKADKNT
ncbi:MAG: FMN-binding protein, partial [Sutterella wadsworthensis]